MPEDNYQNNEHDILHYVKAGVRLASTNIVTFSLGVTIGYLFDPILREDHQHSQLEKLLLAGVGASLLNLQLAWIENYNLTQSLSKAPQYSFSYAAGIYVGLGMANSIRVQ